MLRRGRAGSRRKRTAAQIADELERIHQQTQMGQMMLVTMGYSRTIKTDIVQSLAGHYSLSGS